MFSDFKKIILTGKDIMETENGDIPFPINCLHVLQEPKPSISSISRQLQIENNAIPVS